MTIEIIGYIICKIYDYDEYVLANELTEQMRELIIRTYLSHSNNT
jgi:hypothetical protein